MYGHFFCPYCRPCHSFPLCPFGPPCLPCLSVKIVNVVYIMKHLKIMNFVQLFDISGCVLKTWEVLWGKTSHLLEVLYNQFAGTMWSNLLCKKVGGFLIRCTYIVGSIVLKGRSLIGLWVWGGRMGLVGKELLGQLKSDNIVEIGRSL